MGLSEQEVTGLLALLGRVGVTLGGMEARMAELQSERDAWQKRTESAEVRLAEVEAKVEENGRTRKAEGHTPGAAGDVLTDHAPHAPAGAK
jgi:Tfp pilus assembly protein PilX